MSQPDVRGRAAAWRHLIACRDRVADVPLSAMFDDDPDRAERFSAEACGLYLDYSKQRLTEEVRDRLVELALAADVPGERARMFAGAPLNSTEGRPAWHVALRWPGSQPLPGADDARDREQVAQVLSRMGEFSDAVRSGRWQGYSGAPVRDVVNIGIGGSDLGPAMVCRALDALGHPRIRCHFVSNLDSNHLSSVLERCSADQTLFVICSKTFSTEETLANANSAREWLLEAAGGERDAVRRHFVAVSTALDRCADFGIPDSNVFGFWDWVGGRYSLWSAIGLSIAVYVGMDAFAELLRGGHAMDRHFLEAPPAENLPMLLALVGLWNRNVLGYGSHAVLPYDHALELFPAFLQQLEMESNGKRVDRDGAPLAHAAAPVVWGTLGNNGQHAFYQLLHQGVEGVPVDIIVAARSQRPLPGHESAVIANALAQAQALMRGRSADEVRARLEREGLEGAELERAVAHRVMPGNRPSTTLLYDRLTPERLGALVALYEHKVFVQATCWGNNPFDQFGVELGKQLARDLRPLVEAEGEPLGHDASTRALLARVRSMRAARS